MKKMSSSAKFSYYLGWVLILLYFISNLIFVHDPKPATGILALAGCIFLVIHGVARYGWKGTGLFVVIAYTVSTFLEDLSIHTGFPFGNYHYDLSSAPFAVPFIDQVPVVVGPIYIAVGYLSWTIGSIIMNHADRHLDKKSNIFLLPMVSAFIMVQFDLVQDPSTSTYQGLWVWENGGGFVGVPLVNFLGWYLTCYLFMQLFTLVLAKNQKMIKTSGLVNKKSYWMQPIVLYLTIAFSYVTQYIYHIDNKTEIQDLAGNIWTVANLYEIAVTVMVFTMLYSSVLAIVNLYKDVNGDLKTS
ncbi:carotenoid biosynthesis protein [Arenibacter palladensis]|uniref:carotenoid biosynthesis protein n=1 Tax=Arenibacter palladensis TaxID=237373 RepID=UPI002FD5F6CA|tara:strand:+ start:8155 stop:9054 length:900 start_codon:yes stop_codon:yes gene_type:complete